MIRKNPGGWEFVPYTHKQHATISIRPNDRVCQANSRKYSEFCVAGKEVIVIGLNDWIPLELAEKELSSSLLFLRPDDLFITV